MIVIVLELHRCLKAKLIIGNIRNQPIKYPPLTTNKTNWHCSKFWNGITFYGSWCHMYIP